MFFLNPNDPYTQKQYHQSKQEVVKAITAHLSEEAQAAVYVERGYDRESLSEQREPRLSSSSNRHAPEDDDKPAAPAVQRSVSNWGRVNSRSTDEFQRLVLASVPSLFHPEC